MKRPVVIAISLAVLAPAACSGPLFDDYLNYVRPGVGTGPGPAQAVVASSSPAGQTFTVPDGTGEVYRIGIRPVYDTWAAGETVTMSLYDSRDKKQKLGQYAVDQATSRVQEHKIGNGSQFEDTKDLVLYFQFRKPTGGRSQLYFELAVSGGDGSVSFQGFDKNAYAGGECSAPSVRDLAFECHVKPAADRIANLREFFTNRLDISRPELAAVKAAVDAGDWEKAVAETAKHFHNRMDVWNVWKDVMEPKIDPKADTAQADALVKVAKGERPQGVNWRRESYWAPDSLQGRGIPNPYTWHVDRNLGGAYTATAKPDYARAAIDLRMQFILDNPNPKVSNLPWYFELWNDRTAGARSPGHGDLVYARLYNYPGWTTDERMLFFCFIEDNARWVYQATSGANWGAEAARACYEFGAKFPEWKMSPKYVGWGTARLAEIVMEDVRKDGTSTEAAIKYHAMVARRLKGMVEDHHAKRITLDKATLGEVTKAVEGMYEHMAYTLQPDNNVVMCGDSWYENYSVELLEAARLVKRPDLAWIASQGNEGTPPRVISKVFPGGGYFIMRSDFGENGRSFTDARQVFIHNGGWWGAHGHWDFTSINLFGFGRTLIVDPGQYAHDPPEGIDRYWTSRIHSMLVCEDRDVKREPGPSEWASTQVLDWFDGRHYGYNNMSGVDYVRRRVAFVKPDYMLVDDSAKTTRDTKWTQVWNLADPNARCDAATKAIETTFPTGGNVMILSQDTGRFTVQEAPGITSSSDNIPRTKILRLDQKIANPRFQTLVYPYKAGSRPNVKWERIAPQTPGLGDLFYSVRVTADTGTDWAVFGESGKPVSYRNGVHRVDADFAVVRMGASGAPRSFAWSHGRELVFNKKALATAGADVLALSVSYDGSRLAVEAREPESSLAIHAGAAKSIVLNGKLVARPVVKDGVYYPFADQPKAIVADDRDAFRRVTETVEWARVAEPASWATGYTQHETDPGRHENGDYLFRVPKAGTYRVDVFLPRTLENASDRVELRVVGMGKPVEPGGAVVAVRQDAGAYVITVNQQAAGGWVTLGDFVLQAGELKINSRNATETDGLYFIVDAMRLIAR